MTIHLIAFTERGTSLCSLLTNRLNLNSFDAKGFSKYREEDLSLFNGSLKEFTEKAFLEGDGVIFIGATGIAVRAIAPFITTKDKDPAVVVIDEFGQHIIPVLSGHIGKANELAVKVAELIDGKAIITTATDLNEKFAVDVWAGENGLFIENIQEIKHISAAILNEEKVGFSCDYEVIGQLPGFFSINEEQVGIQISKTEGKDRFRKTLKLKPKEYYLGIGCRKNTDVKALEEFVIEVLDKNNISHHLVNTVATIDIKEKEPAIISLCKKHSYGLKTYTSNELADVKGDFTSSEFVKSIVGVDNVCERSAVLVSGNGNLILGKTSKNGMTIAIAMNEWRCGF